MNLSRVLLIIYALIFIALNGFAQEMGTYIDTRDGKTYRTVKIGSQTWMAENLAYLPIVNVPKDRSDSEPRYYVYGNESSEIATAIKNPNYSIYGVLYNWHAAKLACPKGWHVPSDEEWKQMEMELGLSQAAVNDIRARGKYQGTGMKSKNGWLNLGNGDDSYGMKCLPAGYLAEDGSYYNLGDAVSWWTSTNFDSEFFARVRKLTSEDYGIIRGYDCVATGLSVRCVKD